MSPDFIRDDVSRVFFCFYRLKPEQYDDGKAQEFADAFFINGNSLKNGKLKLELNINMPVRVDGNTVTVDRSMMAEILTHELTHAYRKSKEFAAGHYKWSFPGLDFFKEKLKIENIQQRNAPGRIFVPYQILIKIMKLYKK